MNTIQEDQRDITIVEIDGFEYRVGGNCSKIEPYQEKGVGDWMTWLVVWDGDENIMARIPAGKAIIYYV